jgi:5-(aminomethyl)-3-furanmethanol phosphate kinase
MISVVKVGGSLFDLPDLGPRLCEWLERHAPPEVLLVPGGGPAAEAIRSLDRTHALGEEASHWLALRALAINAALLAALVPGSCVIDGPDLAGLVWEQNRVPVLDAFAFCEADEENDDHLPHTWAVTSDSVAARAAVVLNAAELVLLKSVPPPPGDGAAWAASGYVDHWLSRVLVGTGVRLRAVDLRNGSL